MRLNEDFELVARLTEEEIRDFAVTCGDDNPLHHDALYARSAGYSGIIACGPHYTSMLMGLAASYFSRESMMLGLSFNFRFLQPVFANDVLRFYWRVVAVEFNEKLQGDLVGIKGGIEKVPGDKVLTSIGTVLLRQSPSVPT